ncbi:alanine racemase [Corticibacter populi]|uniref:Alanine racemase n=1 Tax=Corticibacter populi TaxID=1550736 RepID=A0A3M6QJ33_9BURK|nr:alanine racemase [Corticibacter populi]RMX03037.1 alanine racemase [Corticibacter populi]RZS33473.1 alanine racemase [Corticibacter populi]
MPRPIQAIVHQGAVRHNLQAVRRQVPDVKVWAVVKANAYGHGIERVYEPLRGADGFALLDLQEAERVRALGWRGPIVLLEGVFEPRDLEICSRLGIWHAVHCDQQIDWLAAHKTHAPHRVFLKLNGGMNRLGFTPARYRTAWARLSALPQVEEISLMMHFSDADGEPGIERQLAVFREATDGLPGERSICNSAAILRFGAQPGVSQDWVRAGIALYGSSPDYPAGSIERWGLQPAMSLRSRIIDTQQLQPGDTVGYGSRFTAEVPMRIGIVACGYADGYPRICDTGTPVLVDGVRTRTLGRVSMDMLAVDLTAPIAAGHASGFGSEVVLWGRASATHGGQWLPIDEVAAHAQTLGYELMCAVAPRVPFEIEPLQD